MRILIVSQYFWPEHFLVNSLAAELKSRGHTVAVLTGLPNYPQGDFFNGYGYSCDRWNEKYEGVEVMRVPLIPRKKGFFRLAINYASFVVTGILGSKRALAFKPDVIFCFALSPITSCLPGIYLRWRTGRPMLLWVQDLWPESVAAVGASKSPRVLKALGALVRFIYRHCDQILVQSEAFVSSVLHWGATKEQIACVPNWAVAQKAPVQAAPWIRELPAGFKVVFAGNVGKAQDAMTILKAAKALRDRPEIKWIIVGDGSEKEAVDRTIREYQLEKTVFTYGRKPAEDMPALLAEANVLLSTLTAEPIFALTVPSKIQSYLASGRPILAAMNGEGARIVDIAKAGLSCPAESPDALAARVLEFYHMGEHERNQLGQNGKEFFSKHFDQSIVIKQIEDACAKAVSLCESKSN